MIMTVQSLCGERCIFIHIDTRLIHMYIATSKMKMKWLALYVTNTCIYNTV